MRGSEVPEVVGSSDHQQWGRSGGRDAEVESRREGAGGGSGDSLEGAKPGRRWVDEAGERL